MRSLLSLKLLAMVSATLVPSLSAAAVRALPTVSVTTSATPCSGRSASACNGRRNTMCKDQLLRRNQSLEGSRGQPRGSLTYPNFVTQESARKGEKRMPSNVFG
eukprot:2917313-Pleurochrysis_carterae.AAC.1